MRADKGEWIKGVAHWVDGDTAMISVAFTWRLHEARRLSTYYRSLGLNVRIGGPAVFTKRARDYMEGYGAIGGNAPDAVARHNPMATFASRGCPVACHFCIVTPMEGAAFTEFPDFAVRPVLCDNNLSALDPRYQDHIVGRYLREGVLFLSASRPPLRPRAQTRSRRRRGKLRNTRCLWRCANGSVTSGTRAIMNTSMRNTAS